MAEVFVVEALSAPEREACYAIRTTVFCDEQGVSRDIEFDGLDGICRHYLAQEGGDARGTLRTRDLGEGTVKIERMAVLQPHRGRRIGRSLMAQALADAAAGGYRTALLHAQAHAAPFYRKLGFAEDGKRFMEAGIPHVRMTCPL